MAVRDDSATAAGQDARPLPVPAVASPMPDARASVTSPVRGGTATVMHYVPIELGPNTVWAALWR